MQILSKSMDDLQSVRNPTVMCGNCLPQRCEKIFVRLKEQMEEFAGRLVGLCDSLEEIMDRERNVACQAIKTSH